MKTRCVLVAVLLAAGAFTPPVAAEAAAFGVLQMNLCRSGIAGCFDQGGSPLPKATERIINTDPDIVTLNEVCSGETDKMIADVTKATGRVYLRVWQPVGKRVAGQTKPYPCTTGRGEYGIAILARQNLGQPENRRGGYYRTQDGGSEQRAYLCARFAGVNACTTHLSTKDAVRAQCAELRGLLAEYGSNKATVFGGDLNLRHPAASGKPGAQDCVPAGFFRKGDGGVQHIIAGDSYGFVGSTRTVVPGTDHPAWAVALTRPDQSRVNGS